MKLKKLLLPVLALTSFLTISCRKIEVVSPAPDEPGQVLPGPQGDIGGNKPVENINYESTSGNYINNKVGYTMHLKGEVNRNIPLEYRNEGLPQYPLYQNSIKFTDSEKQNILKENDYLRASDSTYNKMDKDGNLYLNDTKLDRVLYKHTASENNYLGNISPNEKAVIKEITIYPDKLGSYVTGLYAAPGEVITITISQEDLNYLKNINEKYNIKDTSNKTFSPAKVIIGQKQERETKENNIWMARDFVRMPLLANTMNVEDTTTYVGSFLGGPVYIDLGNKVNIKPIDRRPVTFTISGAVEYHHYIHGLTTIEDYNRTSKSSAPFFELAVTDNLVRFSGARKYATNTDGSLYTYDDAYECAKLWTKIAKTSHRVPVNSTTDGSISFLFEPFVAAGAAVAFPHYNWVNAPLSWFSGALDSQSFIENGAWGDIHEFNHHHQNYGMGTVGERQEVSNNATSLLSYVSHTNISGKRQKGKVGVMGDYWNEFTNPEYSLKDTINRSKNGTNYSLSGYADLIHAFGVEKFIEITNMQYTHQLPELTNNDERWYYAASIATGYDMTYFMDELLHLKLNDTIKTIVKNLNLPMYVPASLAYQTGQGHKIDGKIKYSDTVRPYVIREERDSILDINNDLVLPQGFDILDVKLDYDKNINIETINEFNYKFNFDQGYTGPIYLTINVINKTLNIKSELRFKLEFDKVGSKVLVNDYLYDSVDYNSNTPSNFLDEEFKNGFNKAKSKTTSFDFDARVDSIKKHHITESVGKIYIPRTATYQFGLKTDKASYLYISKDNKNFKLMAYSNEWTHNAFDASGDKGFYMDLKKGEYLYYKLVTGMPHNDNGYGEIGWGIKTDPNANPRVYSIDRRYILGVNDEFKEVSLKKFPLEEITTPYEYYIDNNNLNGFNINDNSCYLDKPDTFGILNIFDNDPNTRYHSKNHVSADKPIEFSVDLGKAQTFNTLEFTNYQGHIAAPSDFSVYIGDNKDNINTLVKEFNGERVNNGVLEAKLDNEVTTRYVRIVVKKTTSSQFFICGDILFKNSGINYYLHHDSPNMSYEVNKYKANYNVLGTFGKTYDITDGHFKFTFNGTGFAIGSSVLNNNVKLIVKVDNKEYTVTPNSLDAFVIKNLENKKHVVEVKVIGTLNLDAIKYYK